jgi:MerR family mercuric resistance operon transcriptional regulator
MRQTIGAVARAAGVHIETVRYYERCGLVTRPARTSKAYRVYPADTIARLRFIRRAQRLGFSLREIGELLALRTTPGARCAAVRRRAEAKIADIEVRLRELAAMKRALTRLVAACHSGAPVGQCPILESLDVQGNDHDE